MIAPFGLVLPLISAPWSPPARAHAILLIVQIFGERVSAALEWNAVAAYVAPVTLTAYRVHASALWFAVARSPERALAMINVFLWGVNLFYVLLYANVLPLFFATRPVRPSRDNFCGELRPRRRRRLSARLMRITWASPCQQSGSRPTMIRVRFLQTKITVDNYPRPTSGIFDAITVICSTFADNGRLAM